MKEGYEKIYQPLENYKTVVKYKNKYYDLPQIVKATKDSWNQTSKTKYRKLRDPAQWEDLYKFYDINVLLAAPLSNKHLIVTNGDVLLGSTLSITCDNGKSTVYYMEDGQAYKGLYRANIVFKKFIDPNFRVFQDSVFYLDGNMNNTDISNIDYLDPALRRRGKKRTQVVKIGNDGDGNKFLY